MANCSNKITQNIVFDCSDISVAGIANSKAVIINIDDIDRSASTSSGATISNLQLNSGTAGFELSWYKQLGNGSAAFVPDTENVDGFSNSWVARISTSTAEAAERANELKNSNGFVLVTETKYKGTGNADAYKVFGFTNGMILSELTYSTAENAGNVIFSLTSAEGANEQYPFMVLNEGTYTANTASFAALFAEA